MVNKSQQVASQNIYEDRSDDSINKELKRKATAAARSRLYRARKKAEKHLDTQEATKTNQIAKSDFEVPIQQILERPKASTINESLVLTTVDETKKSKLDSNRKWSSSAARLRDYRARKKLNAVNQINKSLDDTSAECVKTCRLKISPTKSNFSKKQRSKSVKSNNQNLNTTNEDILPHQGVQSSNDQAKTKNKTIRDKPRQSHNTSQVQSSDYCDVTEREFNTNMTLESTKSLDSSNTNEIPKGSLQTFTQSSLDFDNNTSISSIAAKMLDLLEQKIDNKTRDDDEAFFESLLPYMKSMDMRQKLLCRMEIQRSVFSFAFAEQGYLHGHLNEY